MKNTIELIKCLIASPGDVAKERDICEEVFDELNREIGDILGFHLESVRWEKDARSGFGEYAQETINQQFEGQYNLFLGLMYARFGTPTPNAGSGTEEEFNIACEKKRNEEIDDVLFYFNNADVPQNYLDLDQYKKVQDFKKHLEELGFFYKTYDGVDNFKSFLKQELSIYVRQKYGKKGKSQKKDIKQKIRERSIIQKELSYKHLQAWRKAEDLLYQEGNLNEITNKIEKQKKSIVFCKSVHPQEGSINQILRKHPVGKEEACLLSMAIDECGLNPSYYSKVIQDDEELEKLPLWKLLKEKEATFKGDETVLQEGSDEYVYENIQRNLFHLDFDKANDLIENWSPGNDFVLQKAMRLAITNEHRDEAKALLSSYIEKEKNIVRQMYAMQIANYISGQYPRPYSTTEFYLYGIDGIGDMLEYMVQQLKGKLEPPRTRGWIGSTMNFGGSYPDYEKSLRILRYISDCGLFISYGITSFMDRAYWYLVFQNLYDIFPYPCFFYSIQYSDNNLLTRIGQDFAYSPKLCEFNEEIIVKAIQAYGASTTPQIFLTGILLVTGPIYISVDEEKWFDVFKNNIFNKLIENFDKLSFSDSIVKNVEHALISLRTPQHISVIFEELIAHYCQNHALVNSFIRYYLRIKNIKNNIPNNIWKSLKDLIVNYPSVDITELFYLLEDDIMTKDVKQLFVDKVKEIGEDNLPQDSSSSFYLCCLTKDNAPVLKIAKKLLLKHDIWHCGVLEDGKTWSTPNYIRLNVFPKEIKWTVTEFNIIKNNLENNINKYKEVHKDLHGETLMRNAQVQYLSDILQFIDGLSESRNKSLKKIREDVERLLNERVSYQTLIEGILSEQTIDANYAMDNVIQGIRAKGFDNYLNEVNFILDRAIMGDSLIINVLLQKISMLVENYKDEINEADLCPKLHTLLTIYKNHWADYHEFRPAWSFSHLYVIAKYLKERGFGESESVVYWMNDPYVQTFIRT